MENIAPILIFIHESHKVHQALKFDPYISTSENIKIIDDILTHSITAKIMAIQLPCHHDNKAYMNRAGKYASWCMPNCWCLLWEINAIFLP